MDSDSLVVASFQVKPPAKGPHMRPTLLVLLSSCLVFIACPSPPATTDTAEPVADSVDAGSEDVPVNTDIPALECSEALDCESVLPGPFPECQVLGCVDGECKLIAGEDGLECGDSSLCGGQATCKEGSCVAGEATTCDDDNPCTTDGCDPNSGCVNTYNQKPCDDGTVCTVGDSCSQGECIGEQLDCDDGNPCTDDSCDKAEGCESVIREGECSDGDACTDKDTCVDGVCVQGTPLECDDKEPCTSDSCDKLTGCVHDIVDGDCDDSNACTSDDSCKEGACLGTVVTCNDGNPCTSDYCDPEQGCVFQPNALKCDDGDACTLNDQCCFEGLGDCELGTCVAGAPDPLCCDTDEECDDAELCTDDSCKAGYCDFVDVNCDDGFECTSDECSEGNCLNDPFGPLESGQIFKEDWETGSNGWTITSTNPDVKWQLDGSNTNSGSNALYCGVVPDYSYDFGATLASIKRNFDLPPSDAITLSLYVLQDLAETGSCTYDVTSVWINGTMAVQLCSNITNFTESVYDLTPYAGQTITLEVRFDTKDGVANDGQGVWVDDITITAQSPEGCCDDDVQCEGGEGCLAEVCASPSWQCGVATPEAACDDDNVCTSDLCGEDGVCTHEDIEGCCSLVEDCPIAPEGECAVPSCTNNACEYDLSGCE